MLAQRWPEHEPGNLAQAVRALVPLVQVPPRAVWGRAGPALHTSAESWLGGPLDPEPSLTTLVRRYLAAFGPATVADIQAWSGLTRLREPVAQLRGELRIFRDEDGRELFDLPGAPRPGPDVPARPALAAEFDNLVLSLADRTRIIRVELRGKMFTPNGIFPGTVLVDGFVDTGMWRITRVRDAATLIVEMFVTGYSPVIAKRSPAAACWSSRTRTASPTSDSPPSHDRIPQRHELGRLWAAQFVALL